jgi:hypothetical protein
MPTKRDIAAGHWPVKPLRWPVRTVELLTKDVGVLVNVKGVSHAPYVPLMQCTRHNTVTYTESDRISC